MVTMGVAAVVAVVVTGQTIGGRLAGVGHAQVALLAHPRQAQAATVGAVEAARHFAPLFPATAHAVGPGIARQPFYVDGQVARAPRQLESPGFFTRARAQAHFSTAFVAFLWNGGRNFVVQHVDHPTHGPPAMDQRRGAAQHFDLPRQQRLRGHGMVGADGGGILHLYTIGEHLHARAIHTPDDRAAGPRTKVA